MAATAARSTRVGGRSRRLVASRAVEDPNRDPCSIEPDDAALPREAERRQTATLISSDRARSHRFEGDQFQVERPGLRPNMTSTETVDVPECVRMPPPAMTLERRALPVVALRWPNRNSSLARGKS